MGNALHGLKDWENPLKINTGKAAAHGVTIFELKKEGKMSCGHAHRQVSTTTPALTTNYGYDGYSRLTVLGNNPGSATNYANVALSYNLGDRITARDTSNAAFNYPLSAALVTTAVNGLNQITVDRHLKWNPKLSYSVV